jgi:hypothetical protein
MDRFSYRIVTERDYREVLIPWWNDWGFPVPALSMLPRNGLIVSDAEGDLYGGFIYFTDSDIVWMEYIVSDKHADVRRKRGALDFLVSLFGEMAKDKILFTSTVRPEFMNSLKKCGFQVGDENVYQLIKV